LDGVLNRLVSLVVSLFESAVGTVRWVGLVMEAAVGQWPTEAFVKEQEQECDRTRHARVAILRLAPLAGGLQRRRRSPPIATRVLCDVEGLRAESVTGVSALPVPRHPRTQSQAAPFGPEPLVPIWNRAARRDYKERGP
jgi:hypothetical protein